MDPDQIPEPPQMAPLDRTPYLGSPSFNLLKDLKDPKSCPVSKHWWYLHGPSEGSRVDQSKNRSAASFFAPPPDLKIPRGRILTLCVIRLIRLVPVPINPPAPEFFGSESLSRVLRLGRRGSARIPRCKTLQSSSKHVRF